MFKEFRDLILRGNVVPQCLSNVPGGARRCAFCTSDLSDA